MDFEKCTLVELRQFAKEKGIKNVSKLKKDELIAILSEESKSENIKSEKENEELRLEVALLKKVRALVKERNARLQGIRHVTSKN